MSTFENKFCVLKEGAERGDWKHIETRKNFNLVFVLYLLDYISQQIWWDYWTPFFGNSNSNFDLDIEITNFLGTLNRREIFVFSSIEMKLTKQKVSLSKLTSNKAFLNFDSQLYWRSEKKSIYSRDIKKRIQDWLASTFFE